MATTTPPSSPVGGLAYSTPKMKIPIRSSNLMTPPDSPQSIRSHADASTRKSLDLAGVLLSPYNSQQQKETDTLGEGQWSRVKRCTADKTVYALKCPRGQPARTVLRHEARILTHLADSRGYREHVVAFHGYMIEDDCILLDCIDLSLQDWVSSNGRVTRLPQNSPGLGLRDLTLQLVNGLTFLHRHGVVHGDIKPGNILLSTEAGAPGFRAVYCDFSASRLVGTDAVASDAAGTYDYMAPELFSLASAEADTTFASDVYALGMTVIHSGLGQSPYSGLPNVYLQRAMAMRGEVLSVVSGAWWQALVEGAVRKASRDRWDTAEWLQVLETLK